MSKVDFNTYLDEQIKLLNEKINDDKHSANDEVSTGKLAFYNALAEFRGKKPSNHARGLIGAVNDTLQQLALIDSKTTLPSLIDKSS